jgi:hypothetical protein
MDLIGNIVQAHDNIGTGLSEIDGTYSLGP